MNILIPTSLAMNSYDSNNTGWWTLFFQHNKLWTAMIPTISEHPYSNIFSYEKLWFQKGYEQPYFNIIAMNCYDPNKLWTSLFQHHKLWTAMIRTTQVTNTLIPTSMNSYDPKMIWKPSFQHHKLWTAMIPTSYVMNPLFQYHKLWTAMIPKSYVMNTLIPTS